VLMLEWLLGVGLRLRFKGEARVVGMGMEDGDKVDKVMRDGRFGGGAH